MRRALGLAPVLAGGFVRRGDLADSAQRGNSEDGGQGLKGATKQDGSQACEVHTRCGAVSCLKMPENLSPQVPY